MVENIKKMVKNKSKNTPKNKSKKELLAMKKINLFWVKKLVDNLNHNVREGNNPL